MVRCIECGSGFLELSCEYPLKLIKGKDESEKRKTNLLEKVSDFSILCGVDACVIIFGPNQNDQSAATAETWPSNPDEVKCIINRYKASDQPRKCYQGSDYFAAKKTKIDAEFAKLHRQVLKSKYPIWDDRLNSLSIDQLGRCQNISHGIQKRRKRNENNNENMDSADFLQLVSNWKSLEAQLPIPFQPGMISHMATPDENSLNERIYNNGYSTLYSEPKPLSVFPPAHYESKQSFYRTPLQTDITEDAMMKMMMSYQSHNNSFGCQASSRNNQCLSCNGPFYVNCILG
uniref:MADS-box domain-containing protein n=1 Tax=Salix viminalis TaxID=40686 RepID=A0A6N2MMY6_SALVM